MGVLGWKEDDFWNSTFRGVIAALEGYYDNLEHREKQSWMQAQFLAWYMVIPHFKKNDLNKLKKQIFFFEDEEKPKAKRLTAEEIRARFGRMDKHHKQQTS